MSGDVFGCHLQRSYSCDYFPRRRSMSPWILSNSTDKSRLPPHKMIPIFLNALPVLRLANPTPSRAATLTAATPAAPLGSTTSLHLSYTTCMASIMSSSETVTTLSTSRWNVSYDVCPILALKPSQMVFGGGKSSTNFFSTKLRAASAPTPSTPAGSHAQISHDGFTAFTLTAMPPIMPPPDIGTNTQSSSGLCSINSKPSVPCPAITRASSYG
mmetsp:Transcript_2175/g.6982  ORF Transcript_2175/g.6982 Transcript_2175/m.6982 type:complete len:214 (+) Transcript_2175:2-643(+)